MDVKLVEIARNAKGEIIYRQRMPKFDGQGLLVGFSEFGQWQELTDYSLVANLARTGDKP